MHTCSLQKVALWMILAMLAASICFAQVGTGRLDGNVVDITGGAMPGAKVTATHEATQSKTEIFDNGMNGIDLLLTPSAKDVALEGLAITGDPLFCRNWSGLGVPSLGFPGAWEDGLPVGLQFVGRSGTDTAMLATAGRLLNAIGVVEPILAAHNEAIGGGKIAGSTE